MVTKIKKNEILFYLSYIILYISLFIGDVYNIGGLDILARYLRICSYILIAISCFNLRFVKKEFLQMMVIFMITLLYAMKTEDLYWSILILLIYNSKKINIESVYRISLRIIIIGIISVLFLCLIGILPDILTSRDTLEQIDYNRHSLGFYHSNVFPLLIFYLEVYYICIVKEKVRDSVIVLFMIFAVIVNVFCRSRNAIIISLLLSVFVILAKKKENGENKLLYHATFSPLIISILLFGCLCTYFCTTSTVLSLLQSSLTKTRTSTPICAKIESNCRSICLAPLYVEITIITVFIYLPLFFQILLLHFL